jgi:hypothetical protein
MKNRLKPTVLYTVVIPDKLRRSGYVVIEEDIASLKQAKEILKDDQKSSSWPASYEIWKETTAREVVYKTI